MSEEHKYTAFDIFLVVAVVICTVFNIYAVAFKKPKPVEGSIASATIVDPKTGKARKYEIARFIENKPNYTQFETTDGRIVEVVESEVTER